MEVLYAMLVLILRAAPIPAPIFWVTETGAFMVTDTGANLIFA